ncbi:MAG: tyrosine-type recombinase/integrase [Desulfovibrio sp.]
MADNGMKWQASGVKGVRFREHPTRVIRNAPDRYFSIRFTRQGRDVEEGLGWASEGWSLRKASDLRDSLRAAAKTGSGPATLAEARQERTRADKAATLAVEKSGTYQALVTAHYIPWAKREKKSAWLDIIRLDNYLFPEFGEMPLDAITTDIVARYRDRLLQNLASATVKQILALLRKTLNVLAARGLFDRRNPVSAVRMPRLDNACERFLTRAEYKRLLDATCEAQCPELHDAVILSVHTGLRLGEIYRLDAGDVDLAHGYLTVREDGGKPGGVVPLNKEVAAMLRRRLSGKRSGPVFIPTDQRSKALSKQFTWLALSIGLNRGDEDRQHRLTFHSLRHTFASWLALADVELYRIQKLMRHKTPLMTQRYAHLRPSGLRENVDVLCSPPDDPD